MALPRSLFCLYSCTGAWAQILAPSRIGLMLSLVAVFCHAQNDSHKVAAQSPTTKVGQLVQQQTQRQTQQTQRQTSWNAANWSRLSAALRRHRGAVGAGAHLEMFLLGHATFNTKVCGAHLQALQDVVVDGNLVDAHSLRPVGPQQTPHLPSVVGACFSEVDSEASLRAGEAPYCRGGSQIVR